MDAQASPFAVLSLIAAPAVLTNASAILTLSTSNRLARAVDREREIMREIETCDALETPLARARLRELPAEHQRVLMLIGALRDFYVALGSFASAVLVSLVGAVLTPVVSAPLSLALELAAIGTGFVAVAALVRGAMRLVRETRVAVGILEERASLVQAEFEMRASAHSAPHPGRPSITQELRA